MNEINTIYADMPTSIRAYTILDNDANYTIVLNAKLNREQHLKSYYHEMRHIDDGDYEKKINVNFLEIIAHSNC